MTTDEAAAPDAQRIARLVEQEQVRLALLQLRRIRLSHLLMDLCIAGVAWSAGVGRLAWGWLVLIAGALIARDRYATRMQRQNRLDAGQMLTRLGLMMTALGALQTLMIWAVFLRTPGPAQYVLTMIMVGTAAGAVSPAAGHLRSYVMWAVVFGGSLVLAWLSRGTLEGTAIATLTVFLFVTMSFYVHDQGQTMAKLVALSESLRHERDRAESERLRAERASEAKTRFFAAASHDLRQPLTALAYNAAAAQTLAQRDGHELLGNIAVGIQRALDESRGLLDSLLEISQLDAGVVKVQWLDIDIALLMSEVHGAFEPQARDHGLDLMLAPAPAPGPLVARTDLMVLRRIVQNIVGNAIKFTPAGSVTVGAQRLVADGQARIVIRIADTGPGIAPDAQERIFEEFYQVGNVERNRSRGLGLGLAIVRRLATLIDAQIRLHSVPGQGATFEIALPEGSVAPQAAQPQAGGAAGRNGQLQPAAVCDILAVDDEPDILDSLSTLLSAFGWRVRTATGRDEALEVLASGFVPDAVLMDFRLRDGASGLDALASLRGHGCRAPAILITGDTAPHRVAAAREAGIPVLYKPVDGHQLIEALNAAVKG